MTLSSVVSLMLLYLTRLVLIALPEAEKSENRVKMELRYVELSQILDRRVSRGRHLSLNIYI